MTHLFSNDDSNWVSQESNTGGLRYARVAIHLQLQDSLQFHSSGCHLETNNAVNIAVMFQLEQFKLFLLNSLHDISFSVSPHHADSKTAERPVSGTMNLCTQQVLQTLQNDLHH